MKKIIIFGFPHSGTSILKSIIGHINDVYELIDEVKYIDIKKIKTNKNIILCKYPYTIKDFFEDKYKDYIKIFIIRNSLFIYSSLNKRFLYNFSDKKNISINEYIKTIKFYIQFLNNPLKDLYLIKYEDLFIDNFNNIKEILDNIGLKYSDKIFDNSQYLNKIVSSIENVPTKKPLNINHEKYRTWQINQQFADNNDIDKIDLLEEQKNILLNDEFINILYPDIKLLV
jgi:hypothetical protein